MGIISNNFYVYNLIVTNDDIDKSIHVYKTATARLKGEFYFEIVQL